MDQVSEQTNEVDTKDEQQEGEFAAACERVVNLGEFFEKVLGPLPIGAAELQPLTVTP
jgi:hypothetical protein